MTLIHFSGGEEYQNQSPKLIIFPDFTLAVTLHANLTKLQHRDDERRIMGE